MITLFGIDADGNCIYTYSGDTYEGETNDYLKHLETAKEILNRQPNIHHVAIVLQTAQINHVFNNVSFSVDLLHLLCRSHLESASTSDSTPQGGQESP